MEEKMSKLKVQKNAERPQHRKQGTYTFQQEKITGEDMVPEYILQDQETEEMTRNKAYELYQQRGYQHGHNLDDWLEAERIGKSRAF